MNTAMMKYNKIICDKGKFCGSITTVQKDIITMVAKLAKRKRDTDNDDGYKKRRHTTIPPPFLTHYRYSQDTKYKLGDTKELNKKKFYFCDCLDHRNRLKWHTHRPEDCHTGIVWIVKGSSNDTFSN